MLHVMLVDVESTHDDMHAIVVDQPRMFAIACANTSIHDDVLTRHASDVFC